MKKSIIISIFILLLDQTAKYFAEIYIKTEQIVVIDGLFSLTYVENTGGAWGIFSSHSVLFLIFIPVIIISILLLARKTTSNIELVSWSLIIGGAAGNYIDRLVRGYVVDFIDIINWPVFNIADISIVTGCAILLIKILIDEKGTQNGKK